jgi:hypothetical protein
VKKDRTAADTVAPAEAAYILGWLLEEKKVSSADLARALNAMHREIRSLEERLGFLRGLESSKRVSAVESRPEPRKTRRVSPAAAASRKLQGTYLNLLRRIPANRRNRFRKIATTNGREAAVKAMQEAIGK